MLLMELFRKERKCNRLKKAIDIHPQYIMDYFEKRQMLFQNVI